ncbi:MAG: Lrp/AsnC ligand binding domain-containing protein [Bacteroidales bacterium]
MARQQLDLLDYKILRLISANARIPFLEIARECCISGAAIHQRVQRLVNLGIINSSDYLINPNMVGFETCAYIGLFLQHPDKFEDVIEKLKKIPEVVECHYTTGQYDMFIKLYAKNNAHLLDIIHDKLQPLGLSRTESIISFKEAFKQPLPIDDLTQK